MDKIINLIKNNKKALIFGITGLLAVILIIIVSIILINVFKKYDYRALENMMVEKTKSYLKANSSLLPTDENKSTIVDVTTLVNEKYMKDLAKISKDTNCTGKVEVVYNNNNYRYSPLLTCDNYETQRLKDVILENEDIKQTGNGIYELNEDFVFKGEYVNNYFNFANESWRIVKFDDEMFYLILADTANDVDQAVYDDRYNETINSYRGYNSFESSRIEKTLNDLYNGYFASYQNYLMPIEACTHSRSETDYNNTGEIECFSTYQTYISLLPVYDYINASNDPLCKTTTSGNCSNYNYLSQTSNKWWLLNGTNENSYDVYVVNTKGKVSLEQASTKKFLRIVIAIPSDVLYKKGDGTSSNPYEFYQY